ncbi:MAG: histidine kinase [Paraburkholderia sp.]|uniref:exopolysaccharide Pel transporter PelG n=1 Tax=Paraburkholderia sp. TaxID=1926495 RepID=UPI001209F5CF|nr:exopolysaccharide Pel transporter PelG [Paraburkholderia sp.]TAM06115.1 MAG: histidine kinase [Paraburkholderia sp.]TAM28678.1 MAG: histidine kinase [Paraburkholderia sp.]
MAGIGFELRKLMARDTLTGVARAYLYAGLISSGPMILSCFGILIIGTLSFAVVIPTVLITQFQVSVTYMIAFSLIVTGPLQLSFTRFVSDRLYEHRDDLVLPNYRAIQLVCSAVSGTIGILAMSFGFDATPLAYRLLMIAGFVIASNIWIAVIFLSSIKQYRQVLWSFAIGYSAVVGLALGLNHYGLTGLLGGFVAGHALLFLCLSTIVHRQYPGTRYISFEVFDRRLLYPSLAWVGLMFNLGVWIDKFVFWFSDVTGTRVVGWFHASVIYDIPVFLAYVCVMPAMAAFLVRIEADFAGYYDAFYDAVRTGATLQRINAMRDMMVRSVRTGLAEIVKVQIVVVLLMLAFGALLLGALHISSLYLPLLLVDVIAASLQVLLLGLFNVMFYLDTRRDVLRLATLFIVLNAILTMVSIRLGPAAYGYGFAAALLIATILAIRALDARFAILEYETYMLQ